MINHLSIIYQLNKDVFRISQLMVLVVDMKSLMLKA